MKPEYAVQTFGARVIRKAVPIESKKDSSQTAENDLNTSLSPPLNSIQHRPEAVTHVVYNQLFHAVSELLLTMKEGAYPSSDSADAPFLQALAEVSLKIPANQASFLLTRFVRPEVSFEPAKLVIEKNRAKVGDEITDRALHCLKDCEAGWFPFPKGVKSTVALVRKALSEEGFVVDAKHRNNLEALLSVADSCSKANQQKLLRPLVHPFELKGAASSLEYLKETREASIEKLYVRRERDLTKALCREIRARLKGTPLKKTLT